MRYWAIYYYTEQGHDYETKELLIDETQFREYQKAYARGDKSVMFKDRQIAMSAIREITPADDIVQEYISMGVKLESIGLPLPDSYKKLEGLKENKDNDFKSLHD